MLNKPIILQGWAGNVVCSKNEMVFLETRGFRTYGECKETLKLINSDISIIGAAFLGNVSA